MLVQNDLRESHRCNCSFSSKTDAKERPGRSQLIDTLRKGRPPRPAPDEERKREAKTG